MSRLRRLLDSIWHRMEGVTEEEELAILEGEAEIARGNFIVLARPARTLTGYSGTAITLEARLSCTEAI